MSQINDHDSYRHILLLGGTAEARHCADSLVGLGARITSSLAGRTKNPVLPKGEVRIGGFGGADGLARWLVEGDIDLVIDATHPYAAQMSRNAVAACAKVGVRLIRLERAQWVRPEHAPWVEVRSMADAAAMLPGASKVFLTIGRQDLAPFVERTDCRFVARMIEVPDNVPPDWQVIAARGPFSLAAETALFEKHGFSHIVSKNSGGDETRAKIDAAAALGVPVLMIARPVLPAAETAPDVECVLHRLAKA